MHMHSNHFSLASIFELVILWTLWGKFQLFFFSRWYGGIFYFREYETSAKCNNRRQSQARDSLKTIVINSVYENTSAYFASHMYTSFNGHFPHEPVLWTTTGCYITSQLKISFLGGCDDHTYRQRNGNGQCMWLRWQRRDGFRGGEERWHAGVENDKACWSRPKPTQSLSEIVLCTLLFLVHRICWRWRCTLFLHLSIPTHLYCSSNIHVPALQIFLYVLVGNLLMSVLFTCPNHLNLALWILLHIVSLCFGPSLFLMTSFLSLCRLHRDSCSHDIYRASPFFPFSVISEHLRFDLTLSTLTFLAFVPSIQPNLVKHKRKK